MNGLEPPAYWVIGLYLAGTLAMGWYFSRRQETTEDYFVGGRRMPWLAVGLSTLATLTSTITYLAVPGEMIRYGVGYFTNLLAVPFTLAFICLVTVPFLLRLRLTSGYEYLELRFDARVRLLGATLFALLGLGWMSTVVYSAGFGVAEITGMPLWAVLAAVGAIGVLYTTMGGIRADIWTDVLQAGLMFGGAVVTIATIAGRTGTGPVDWWADASLVEHTRVPVWDLNPFVRISVISVCLHSFFWNICQVSGSQVAMQRFFTMPDVRSARRAAVVNAVANVGMLLLLAVCGVALFSFYLRRPDLLPGTLDPRTGSGAERIFPHFIASQLPPVVAGLVISALFAAAMSTLDSGVNSLAAVATMELRRRKGPRSPAAELRAARRWTLALGALVTLLAFGLAELKGRSTTLIEILPAAFNWVLGPLGGIFLAGMFLPRCSARSVIPAALVGSVVGLPLALLKPAFQVPFSFTWVTVYSCLATILAAALLSMRERAGKEPLTWRTVVRRPN